MADVNELGFSLAPFSSRGPTRDNRMKPDISAPGVAVTAPKANSSNQYVAYSGTSMATPFDGVTPPRTMDARSVLTRLMSSVILVIGVRRIENIA